mmetsp:Transcript_5538/g.9942  ORF Transcript_5538/g.9942 Transcript_5538/m.9942 type:complete len:247 (+) Transcript_5538:327-1067(+)
MPSTFRAPSPCHFERMLILASTPSVFPSINSPGCARASTSLSSSDNTRSVLVVVPASQRLTPPADTAAALNTSLRSPFNVATECNVPLGSSFATKASVWRSTGCAFATARTVVRNVTSVGSAEVVTPNASTVPSQGSSARAVMRSMSPPPRKIGVNIRPEQRTRASQQLRGQFQNWSAHFRNMSIDGAGRQPNQIAAGSHPSRRTATPAHGGRRSRVATCIRRATRCCHCQSRRLSPPCAKSSAAQ